jgi:hypothetical protein
MSSEDKAPDVLHIARTLLAMVEAYAPDMAYINGQIEEFKAALAGLPAPAAPASVTMRKACEMALTRLRDVGQDQCYAGHALVGALALDDALAPAPVNETLREAFDAMQAVLERYVDCDDDGAPFDDLHVAGVAALALAGKVQP